MIGVFDSGIGGITVINAVIKKFPKYKYIYYSDSLNNPYGDKSKEELLKITENVISKLISKGCQIIVIGCNTASTNCYEELKNKFSIPIIKIEPSYQLLLGKTLIMATSSTIKSKRFKEILKEYDKKSTYICECPGLADLIENEEDVNSYLNKKISKFKGVDNVVLGCTHYPLIKEAIRKVLGNVKFYDGVEEVVNTLQKELTNIKETKFDIEFIDSSHSKSKKERFFKLLTK